MDAKKLGITIWKDGSWKMWGTVDAIYARSDPDWLTDIGLTEILESAENEIKDVIARNAGGSVLNPKENS